MKVVSVILDGPHLMRPQVRVTLEGGDANGSPASMTYYTEIEHAPRIGDVVSITIGPP
jgi:hypothetical protein